MVRFGIFFIMIRQDANLLQHHVLDGSCSTQSLTSLTLSSLLFHPLPPFLRHLHTSRVVFQPLPRNIRNRNQRFDKNVTKRGNVPAGKAAERVDDFPVSKTLIGFFLVVVVGSSLVQIFNMFSKAPSLDA
jgi:hypothetical protein